MHDRTIRAVVALLPAAWLLVCPVQPAHGQPVVFTVETQRGSDTLYVGERAYLSFNLDGQGAQIQGVVYPLLFTFGAGNLMAASPNDVAYAIAPPFENQFSFPVVKDSLTGTDPDTLLAGAVATGGPWVTNGSEYWMRLNFQPLAPGQIAIDSTMLPPANRLAALSPIGDAFPLTWATPTITVLPCPNVLGDVNQSGQVTSADIIALVNCIFKCGPGIFAELELGDVNCSGMTTVSDVILIVNYVFKGMPLPFCCNVLD